MPYGSDRSTSAPPATSGSTHATQPSRAAYSSGVNPPVCMILMRGSAVTRRSQSCARAARVDRGAVLEQQANHVGMLLRRGPHQRRLPAERLARIHARAVLEQHARRIDAARARDDHQRRLPLGVRRLDVGAGLEQRADDLARPPRRPPPRAA